MAEREVNQDKGLSAIIVAAGYSFRMERFKPLLPLGGSTVLEQAVNSFSGYGIKDIRVVVGYRANELVPILKRLGVNMIVNADFPEGMFSSVCAGVKSLLPETDGFFLLPVDNPIVSRRTLDMLVKVFRSSKFGIVYPSYQGMRGHPPLISTRYANEILTWKNAGGMRALLEEHDFEAFDVDVDDPGILLDMDTQEDYHKMLKYYGDIQLPSEEECFAMIKHANTPLNVINHCKQVAQLGCELGYLLIRSGCLINLDLIKTAGLLHDLAKGVPDHAQAGADMLVKYPEVAKIVAEHMDISLKPRLLISEKEIVYLADKLVIGERIVSLRERFAGPLEQNKKKRAVTSKIKRRLRDAERIQTKIEEIIKMPLHELWNYDKRGKANGK